MQLTLYERRKWPLKASKTYGVPNIYPINDAIPEKTGQFITDERCYPCHLLGWLQLQVFTKSLQLLSTKNHVRFLSLPPHPNHKIQPLDKTFMAWLQKYLAKEIRKRVLMQTQAVRHYDSKNIWSGLHKTSACRTGH